MQRIAVLVLLLCVLPTAAQEGQHPVAGVITLLQELADRAKTEGETEAQTYATYETWCKNSMETLNTAIQQEKATIESLENEVSAKTLQVKNLENELADLQSEIGRVQALETTSEQQRKEANDLYTAQDEDYATTIDAIQQAIDSLEETRPSAASLLVRRRTLTKLIQLPLVLEKISEKQQQELMALDDTAISSAPAAAFMQAAAPGMPIYTSSTEQYTFKSGNVIDLLKELKTKFENDKEEATNAETQALNEYTVAKDANTAALEAAQASQESKTTLLGETQTALQTAETDLSDTKGELEADSQTLSETKTSCEVKANEWAERSKIREHEIEALNAGVKILAEVSGVRTTPPENPVLPTYPVENEATTGEEGTEAPATSFLQIKALDPKQKVVNLLREEAKAVKSKTLQRFAEQVAAKLRDDDPLAEVTQMIQKMIFRLMQEQNDEDSHKAWCDVELSKTNSSIANKEQRIAGYTAKIDADKATVAALEADVLAANNFATTLQEHMKEAAEIRQTAKKENEAAIQDAADAQAALGKAMAVITTFYKDSGAVPKESWEFVQKGVDLPEEPSTWDASYTGVTDPQGQPDGIITVLKEVSADFAQMEADTRAQEEQDKKAYDDQMQEADIDKARRMKEAELKQAEAKRLLDKVNALEKTKKTTEHELGAVEQYLKDLAPACIEGDSTYEERKESRNREIDALKEAQGILKNAMKGSSAPAPAPAAFLQK